MFGFAQKCPVCGMKIEKENALERLGRKFCSEGCAKEYESGKQQAEKPGCCH